MGLVKSICILNIFAKVKKEKSGILWSAASDACHGCHITTIILLPQKASNKVHGKNPIPHLTCFLVFLTREGQ